MEQTQLALVTKDAAIELPGCKLTATGVEFDANVTKENLNELGIALQKVEGCRGWWWGDWVNKMRELNGNIAAEFVEESGLRLSTLWSYSEVANFYPTRTRIRVLTMKHHRLARFIAGGELSIALEWLQKAVDNNWTTAQMNRAIRDAKAIEQDPSCIYQDKSLVNKMKYAISANRWARAAIKEAEAWPSERVEAVFDELCDVAELIDLLRERIAQRQLRQRKRSA